MKTAIIMPVVTNLWKVKVENCTAWKSGTARKSSLNLVTKLSKGKGEGKGKTDRECSVSAVDAVVSSEQIAEPKLTSMGDSQNLRPKGKVLEVVRTQKQRPHKMCQLGPLFWGPLMYCQTTVMRWRMTNPHMKPKK